MSEMEIEPDEGILARVAKDGFMDYTSWPGLLPTILRRIDNIAHNEFPTPRVPPPKPPVRAASPRLIAPLTSSDPVDAPGSSGTTPLSQETNKENANPSSLSTRIPVSNAIPSSSTTISAPGNHPAQQEGTEPGSLPPPIAALLSEITSTLSTEFAEYPPHTIQRLAEVLLNPRKHYRHLIPFLHALDRVVHVTSGANTYPLLPAVSDMSSMSGGSNGVGSFNPSVLTINSNPSNSVGSDEALGGARLTPIPWLKKSTNGEAGGDLSDPGGSSPSSMNPNRAQQSQLQPQVGAASRNREPQLRTESTETIEGPNGKGSIETVTISLAGPPRGGAALANRGVVHGADIFRQEQRAGVGASSQQIKTPQQEQETTPANPATGTEIEEDSAMAEGDDPEDEVPHARGPETIGLEDTGPQSTTRSRSTRGPDGAVEVEGLDVEAAVGRKASTPEEAIPKSQKHEAADKLESPAKRRESEGEEGLPKASFGNTEEQRKESGEGSAIEDPAPTIAPGPSDSAAADVEAAPQLGEKMDSEEPQPENVKSSTEEDKVDEPMTDTKPDEEEERASTKPGQGTVEVDHSDAILGEPAVAD